MPLDASTLPAYSILGRWPLISGQGSCPARFLLVKREIVSIFALSRALWIAMSRMNLLPTISLSIFLVTSSFHRLRSIIFRLISLPKHLNRHLTPGLSRQNRPVSGHVPVSAGQKNEAMCTVWTTGHILIIFRTICGLINPLVSWRCITSGDSSLIILSTFGPARKAVLNPNELSIKYSFRPSIWRWGSFLELKTMTSWPISSRALQRLKKWLSPPPKFL